MTDSDIKLFFDVYFNNFIPNAKCILITNSEEAVIDCDGINIEVIPIWKWLLDN